MSVIMKKHEIQNIIVRAQVALHNAILPGYFINNDTTLVNTELDEETKAAVETCAVALETARKAIEAPFKKEECQS